MTTGISISTLGEFVLIDSGNDKLVMHQAKSGFVYIYDRVDGGVKKRLDDQRSRHVRRDRRSEHR